MMTTFLKFSENRIRPLMGRDAKTIIFTLSAIGCAAAAWIVSRPGFVPKMKLRKKLLSLLWNKSVDFIYPWRLTVPGKHYAKCREGVQGFVFVDGFSEKFVGVPNLFGPVRLIEFCGLSVVLRHKVERIDEDTVRLSYDELDIERIVDDHQFITDSVATSGYYNPDGVPMVQVQLSPFVGCDLKLVEYEELRIRTGIKPNLGYMEFNSKHMTVTRDSLPTIGEALKREMRITHFEPWFGAVGLDGDGDVEVALLQEEGDVETDHQRPAGCLFPTLLDVPSVVYAVNRSSELTTFAERIAKYIKDDTFVLPDIYHGYLAEFLELLIPASDVGTGYFDDQEAVLARQTRPTQKLGFEETKDNVFDLRNTVDSTFQKGEVYPEMKAPRNIVNPDHQKRVYTNSVVSPLSQFLKATSLYRIYGFGDAKYVEECFDKVAEQDTGMGKLEADGTKMDANIHKFFRDLEWKVLERWFAVEHHEILKEIHEAQYSCKYPKSKKGTRLNLRESRRSGEGGTSIFNTIAMVFVAYCALRLPTNTRPSVSAEVAWSRIGVHGGDDSLMAAFVSPDLLCHVGDEVGLPLKVKYVDSWSPYSFLGITRLNRGCSLYVCDVSRFVGKISYSHVKNVPSDQIMYRKCEPYVHMYPNVPLVSNLCRAVIRVLNNKGFKIDAKYDELCRTGAGFVMTMLDGTLLPGPSSDEEYYLCEDYVCDALNLPLGKLREVCEAYDLANDFSEFPSGFITGEENFIITGKYEALFRDLYIPGLGALKLQRSLHTESKYGCTKSLSDGKTQQEQSASDTDQSNSSSTVGTDSNHESGASAASSKGKKPRKRGSRRKTDSRRSSVPEVCN